MFFQEEPISQKQLDLVSEGLPFEIILRKWFKNVGNWSFSILSIKPFIAFHDCVGPDGCDGCLNTNDSENDGLLEIVERLSDVKAGSRRVPAFDVGVKTDIDNFSFFFIW